MASDSSSLVSSGVPPGFRFHPTDEELLLYYLKKKVCFEKFDLDVIREIDLNKTEPWDLQERCRIGGGATQSEWYFFSHKDRKYPTGSRTNRATSAGFWKATGRDKCIRSTCSKLGMRKTLVFYRGRAPHGQKTDWIMHEYRLHDPQAPAPEDGWVVCRVFRKKCFYKIIGSGGAASNAGPSSTTADRSLAAQYFSQQQILQQAYSSTAAALYKPELGLQYYTQLDLLPAHRGVTGYHDFSVVSHECDLLQEVGGGMEVMENLEERFGGVVEHMNAMPQQCDMDMALWGYGSRRD